MSYQFESRIRFSETGLDRKLTLVSLIDYFQDCSTFHSELCGHGLDYCREHGRAWMILSWQVEILRRPSLGEQVTVQTWPNAFKAFYGHRNYCMLDKEGNYLAKANSIWAWIDMESGHPAKVLPEDIAGYVMEPRLEMQEFPRKIHMPEENTRMESFPVTRNNLDTNHHVNNGQYIRMAEEYLPDGFETGILRVEYRQQAHLHDEIVPLVHEDAGTFTVGLCDHQENPFSILVFTRA